MFMLNSAEDEILKIHLYNKNIKKIQLFQAQLSLKYYFPAHKCEFVNNCWHFNIYE